MEVVCVEFSLNFTLGSKEGGGRDQSRVVVELVLKAFLGRQK